MAHAHKIRMQEKKLYMKVPVTVKAVYWMSSYIGCNDMEQWYHLYLNKV